MLWKLSATCFHRLCHISPQAIRRQTTPTAASSTASETVVQNRRCSAVSRLFVSVYSPSYSKKSYSARASDSGEADVANRPSMMPVKPPTVSVLR